jgi:ubiquinone/menaquinone biosynthesis C-methylase UbiE
MKISDIFWNLLAPFYAKLRHNPISGHFLKKENRAIEVLLENIASHDIKSACDLGVGRGHSFPLIPESIPHRIAIDKSFPMIRLTRKDFPKTIFIQADVLNLPLKNSSFDLIFCIGLMEYIPKVEPLIAQLNTILKNRGYLLLSFSPKTILTYLRLLRGHRIYARKSEEIKNYFKGYQFEILGLEITPLQHQYLLQKKN